jgi:hypothetical protein
MRSAACCAILLAAVAACQDESVRPCVEESICDATPDIRVMFRTEDSAYARQLRVAITTGGETHRYVRADFRTVAGELFVQHAMPAADSVTVRVTFAPQDSGGATFTFHAGEYTRNHIHLHVRPAFRGVPVCEQLVGNYRVAVADSLSVLYGAWDRRSATVAC